MRVEDNVLEEVEEPLEYISFLPTRFCRTDEEGLRTLTGTYFPNYQIVYNKVTGLLEGIDIKHPRPRPALRDDAFTEKVIELKGGIEAINGAVGILYAIKESEEDPDFIGDWGVGTFAVYEVRGKRVGITVLHIVGEGVIDPTTCKFYVDANVDRWRDKTQGIRGSVLSQFVLGFVEVKMHAGALAKRTEYLNSLSAASEEYKENLDPEFGQCSEPVLDAMMFEIPASLASWPHLTLADNKPASNALALLVAYHSTIGGRKGMGDEYVYTTKSPPNPGEVVWIHRSLGVGKVATVGDGIANIINSTAHMSSGGPLLNAQLKVFAINLGGFYDYPGDPKKAPKPIPAPWTKAHVGNLYWYDVKLPENEATTDAKKNRTIGLSVFHRGFVSMLSAIAP